MLNLFFSAVSVASVVIAVAGLVTLLTGLLRLRAAARSRSWPTVPGTVLSASVEEKQVEALRRDSEGAEPGLVTLYKPNVSYRYTVGQKELTGSRVAFDELETGTRAPAEEVVARYPAGTAVKVFHAPRDPEEAVLEPGISGVSAFLPSVGFGLMLLGGAMFGLVWKLSGR